MTLLLWDEAPHESDHQISGCNCSDLPKTIVLALCICSTFSCGSCHNFRSKGFAWLFLDGFCMLQRFWSLFFSAFLVWLLLNQSNNIIIFDAYYKLSGYFSMFLRLSLFQRQCSVPQFCITSNCRNVIQQGVWNCASFIMIGKYHSTGGRLLWILSACLVINLSCLWKHGASSLPSTPFAEVWRCRTAGSR